MKTKQEIQGMIDFWERKKDDNNARINEMHVDGWIAALSWVLELD